MKKSLNIVFALSLLSLAGFSQVQGTIKLGSQPNSVIVTFKPASTISAAKFSSFQFAVGIPAVSAAGVTASVTSLDPLMSYVPLASTESQGGINYSVFSFSGDGSQAGVGTDYSAGVEYNYAEVFFMGPNISISDVRLMQLPNGGTSSQVNFYVANSGTDVTNTVAQFYSSVPANVSNDGNNYAGSSFVTIGTIVLPVKFLGFNVIKKEKDAYLTWQIENETSITDRYEIERSANGVDFTRVTTITPKNNGSSTNTYTFTDINQLADRSGGVVYYRIKQIDKDGKFIITPIRNLRLDSRAVVINVYPNPVKDFANITFDLLKDENVIVTVNDAAGKQVQNISYTLFKGLNVKKINMGSLASGSYLLKVSTATEMKTIPLVKRN
jgi:hypothetical protein